MKSDKAKQLLDRLVLGILLCVVAAVNLSPFIWGILTSLKPARELMTYPPKLFGSYISLEHYETVLRGSFTMASINSILYSLVTVITGVIFSILAAYAMTRFVFRGRKVVFHLILVAIPLAMGSAALVIPNYIMFSSLGMVNKWGTLPIIYLTYNLPMIIWIMIGGMKNISYAIEEAATIDGASRWYIIFILIPRISLPTIACVGLLTFIGVWNEFTVSSVLVNTQELYPIQVSIYNYIGYFGREWGPLTAAASLAVIPVLIIFSLLGKMLISGLTAGAVKE